MVRNFSGNINTERVKKSVQLVYLVEIDATDWGESDTTYYYASRKYTLDLTPSGTQVYTDGLAPNGISTDWVRLNRRGGLPNVGGFSVRLRNEGDASDIQNTYTLEGDQVRLYMLFVDGTEDEDDKVLLRQGVIESVVWDKQTWTISVKDESRTLMRTIPTRALNYVEYPNAPLDAVGQVLPFYIGEYDQHLKLETASETNADYVPTLTAPLVAVDILGDTYLAGPDPTAGNGQMVRVLQYVSQANRYVEVTSGIAYSQSGGSGPVVDIIGPDRHVYMVPTYEKTGNAVTDWGKLKVLGDAVLVLTGGDGPLKVVMGGMAKVGTVTDIDVYFTVSTGGCDFDYNILLGTTSKASGTITTNGTTTVNLSAAATDHADTWDFERYSIELTIDAASGTFTLKKLYMDINYDDATASGGQALPLVAAMDGFDGDNTSYYGSGRKLGDSTAGYVVRGSRDALELLFRHNDLLGLAEADLRTSDGGTSGSFGVSPFVDRFNDAANQGTTNALIPLTRPRKAADVINDFCRAWGVHVFQDGEGKWKAVPRRSSPKDGNYSTYTVGHALDADTDIPVKNPGANPAEWTRDVKLGRTPVSEVVNKFNLRYHPDLLRDTYGMSISYSSEYRLKGTCTFTTLTITDSGADFVNDGVVVGWRVCIDHASYTTFQTITAVTATTISWGSGANGSGTSHTYWVGPNIHAHAIRSRERYGFVGTFSGRDIAGDSGDVLVPYLRGGSATTNYPADQIANYLIDWFSDTRLTIEFSTYWEFIRMELGDIITIANLDNVPSGVKWEVMGMKYDFSTAAFIRVQAIQIPDDFTW